jgi:hypothetical protein
LTRRWLPQMGQVALVPDESRTMKVVQPLVLQSRRREAAERRSLRCAEDRWLKPAVENVRDNISGIRFPTSIPRHLVRARAIGYGAQRRYGSERVHSVLRRLREPLITMLAAEGAHGNQPEV